MPPSLFFYTFAACNFRHIPVYFIENVVQISLLSLAEVSEGD